MQSTLGGVKLPVTDVAHVNLPQKGIGFPDALQDTHGADPIDHRQTDTPPGTQAEAQGRSREGGDQYQFPISTQQLVRPVDGGVNHHGSWCRSVGHD
jgi:hypothetical protein